MAWRDRMYPASWRGVPFFVRDHDLSGGHRLAKHLLAGVDGQVSEDIARSPEGFSVSAFVYGKEYDRARDALLSELRKGGFGELIHPWLGTLRVKCEAWSLSETGQDGGTATFSLNFIESGDYKYPTSASDSKSKAEAGADTTVASSKKSFEGGFSVTGFPAYVAESAAAQVEKVSDSLSGITTFVGGASADVASLSVQISKLKSDAMELVNTPNSLANSIGSSIDLLNKSLTVKRASFSLFDFGSDLDDFSGTTPATVLQQKNQRSMNILVRSCAISAAIREAVSLEFETQDDAIDYRQAVLDSIDNLLEQDIDDETYNNMVDLRLDFIKSLNDLSTNLPKIKEYPVRLTVPSLVLSQLLYGTPNMADDIVARNKIAHPGFIFGETVVKVLVDV